MFAYAYIDFNDNDENGEYLEIMPFGINIETYLLNKYIENWNSSAIGLFLYMVVFSCLPFHEIETGFKTVQQVSPIIFWSSTFIFDSAVHFGMMTVVLVTHVIFDRKVHLLHDAELSNGLF